MLIENRRFEPAPLLFDLVKISPRFLASVNESLDIVCMILHLAVMVQCHPAMDRWMDRRTDRRMDTCASTASHSKNGIIHSKYNTTFNRKLQA